MTYSENKILLIVNAKLAVISWMVGDGDRLCVIILWKAFETLGIREVKYQD